MIEKCCDEVNSSSHVPSHASYIQTSPRFYSPHLDVESPLCRPLHKMDFRSIGKDYLKDLFYAGTPCSLTHLLWFLIEGEVSIDYGQGKKRLKKGQVCICPAIYPHWVELISPEAEGLWIHLNNTPRWSFLSTQGPLIQKSIHLDDLNGLILKCLDEMKCKFFGFEQNMIHYSNVLSVVLQRELNPLMASTKIDPFFEKLSRLLSSLSAKPEAPWNLTTMAKIVGTTPRHLHRLILKRYQVNPMQLVTRLRIDRAIELLKSTDLKLDDIAPRVGYHTAYSLSNAFLRHTGLRPSTYRT